MTASEILQHAYVITNGGERLEQFRRTFGAVGLADPLPKAWDACMAPERNGVALGCSISHYSLVRHAREAGLPWLVVFEDDAVPADLAAEELVKEFDEHREDGTLCLSLGWNYDSDPDKGRDRNAKRRVYGSTAYILFGPKGYDAFMDAFTRNGAQIDVTLDIMDGSRMSRENLFVQHSPTPSMHSAVADTWAIDAEIERAVNAEATSRFAAARAEVAKIKREKAIHVAYCVDVQGGGAAQFEDQLYVSIRSLRGSRAKGESIVCHVLYGNIPAETMERIHALETDGFHIETRSISAKDLAFWQRFSRHDPRSPARPWGGIVYARLWLPLLLRGCDRCIYLDADTMVRSSLSDLWNTCLGGKLLGMNMGSVPEYGYNSGVMLMDLAAMRADSGLYKQLAEFMAKNSRAFFCPDQTTINRFFADQIFPIGREWNYPPTSGAADPEMAKAKIWHFYNGVQKPYRLVADDAGRALVEWNRMLTQGD